MTIYQLKSCYAILIILVVRSSCIMYIECSSFATSNMLYTFYIRWHQTEQFQYYNVKDLFQFIDSSQWLHINTYIEVITDDIQQALSMDQQHIMSVYIQHSYLKIPNLVLTVPNNYYFVIHHEQPIWIRTHILSYC